MKTSIMGIKAFAPERMIRTPRRRLGARFTCHKEDDIVHLKVTFPSGYFCSLQAK